MLEHLINGFIIGFIAFFIVKLIEKYVFPKFAKKQ